MSRIVLYVHHQKVATVQGVELIQGYTKVSYPTGIPTVRVRQPSMTRIRSTRFWTRLAP